MKRKFGIAVLLFLTVFFMPAQHSLAREKESALSAISVNELYGRIKNLLMIFPEITDFMPEIKTTTGADGDISEIKYNVSGVFTNLETLDRGSLIKVYKRVNIERARIQGERIQRQLESIRASRHVHTPHKVHMPPETPKIPPAPPKIPLPLDERH